MFVVQRHSKAYFPQDVAVLNPLDMRERPRYVKLTSDKQTLVLQAVFDGLMSRGHVSINHSHRHFLKTEAGCEIKVVPFEFITDKKVLSCVEMIILRSIGLKRHSITDEDLIALRDTIMKQWDSTTVLNKDITLMMVVEDRVYDLKVTALHDSKKNTLSYGRIQDGVTEFFLTE